MLRGELLARDPELRRRAQLKSERDVTVQPLSPPPTEPRGTRSLPAWLPRLVASLVVGGLFVMLFRRGDVPIVPPPGSFRQVHWWAVVGYFLSLFVVHWFRAWRWDYLLRPVARVPTSRIIAIAWVGFFAIMMLPLRMGEVVRPVLLRRDGKISGSAAMGTIAAERVLDGLFVALLLAATLAFVPRLPLEGVVFGGFPVARVVTLGYLTVAVFATALVVLSVFFAARRFAEAATLKVVGLVSDSLARRLSRMVGSLADGLRSLPDPRLMVPFLAQTSVYWGFNALGMWFLGWGCGLPMNPAQGFAVMGVLAMGILLPAGPGLFGPFQFSIFLALRMFFPDEVVRSEGVAYVFLMYLCQFVFTTLMGIGALWFGHIDPHHVLDQGTSSAPPAPPAP